MKKSILLTALVSLLFASCSSFDETSESRPLPSEPYKTNTISRLEQINANLLQNKTTGAVSDKLAFTDNEKEFNKVGEMFTRGMSAVMEADKEKSLNKDNIDRDIIDLVDSSMGGMSPLERKIVESDEFKAALHAAETESDSNDTGEADSLSEKIVKMYLAAIESFGESVTDSDVLNVTNQYIAVVRSSAELSDDDKNILYVTLSIGNAAFKFWSKFLG